MPRKTYKPPQWGNRCAAQINQARVVFKSLNKLAISLIELMNTSLVIFPLAIQVYSLIFK